MSPLITEDGRYIVVRGRLWRASNPALSIENREALIQDLMSARRAVREALRSGDAFSLADARAAVNAAKVSLGERGPVWWADGGPDFNRRLVKHSPYAEWYLNLRLTDASEEDPPGWPG